MNSFSSVRRSYDDPGPRFSTPKEWGKYDWYDDGMGDGFHAYQGPDQPWGQEYDEMGEVIGGESNAFDNGLYYLRAHPETGEWEVGTSGRNGGPIQKGQTDPSRVFEEAHEVYKSLDPFPASDGFQHPNSTTIIPSTSTYFPPKPTTKAPETVPPGSRKYNPLDSSKEHIEGDQRLDSILGPENTFVTYENRGGSHKVTLHDKSRPISEEHPDTQSATGEYPSVGHFEWKDNGGIDSIRVHPNYQRMGIGTHLYNSAKEIAGEKGLTNPQANHPDSHYTEQGKQWALKLPELTTEDRNKIRWRAPALD